MRRMAIAGAAIGVALLVARRVAPRLHAGMLEACKGMFEQMPDDFPPKRMMGGIEEIRAITARTLELLEERKQAGEAEALGKPSSARANELEALHV